MRNKFLALFILLTFHLISIAQISHLDLHQLSLQIKNAITMKFPSDVVDLSTQLVDQAAQVGDLSYTLEGIETYKKALQSIDYLRSIERFALLHKVWQMRDHYSPRDQRILALYIAIEYYEQQHNWRNDGLGLISPDQGSYIPCSWAPLQYLETIDTYLTFAFDEGKVLYDLVSDIVFLPNTFDSYHQKPSGQIFLLSQLIQSLPQELLQPDIPSRARLSAHILRMLKTLPQGHPGAALYAQFQYETIRLTLGEITSESYYQNLRQIADAAPDLYIEGLPLYTTLFDRYQESDRLLAYQYAEQILQRLSRRNDEELRSLRERQQNLLTATWHYRYPHILRPEQISELSYSLANLSTLTFALFALPPEQTIHPYPKVLSNDQQPLWQIEVTGEKGVNAIRTQTGKIALPSLPIGHYLLRVTAESSSKTALTSSPPIQYNNIIVSPYALIQLPSSQDGYDHIQVVSADQGTPIPPPITLWQVEKTLEGSHLSSLGQVSVSSLGHLSIPRDTSHRYQYLAQVGDSPLFLPLSKWEHHDHIAQHTISTDLLIQTDRSLYRPGQQVHCYIISSQSGYLPQDAKLLSKRKIHLSLYNANDEVTQEITTITDAWGRCEALLQIPETGLTGYFTIIAQFLDDTDKTTYRTNFLVSEYQRPNYQTTLTLPTEYTLGQVITASGTAKTYSGYPLIGAKVYYTIQAEYSSSIYRNTLSGRVYDQTFDRSEVIAEGEVPVQESDGTFAITFPLKDLTPTAAKSHKAIWTYHHYTLTATITAASGETQHLVRTLWIGQRPLHLSYEGPSVFFTDRLDDSAPQLFQIFLANSEGDSIVTPIALHLQRQAVKTSGFDYSIPSCTKIPMPIEWRDLPSGTYQLQYSYTTSSGERIEEYSEIQLFDSNHTTIPADTFLWSASPHDIYSDDQPITIYYGSMTDQQPIYYLLKVADQVLQEGELPRLPARQVGIWHPSLPKSIDPRGQVAIRLYTMYQGQLLEDEFQFTRKQSSRTLHVSWIDLQSREQAGTERSWSVRLSYNDGTPASEIPVAVWMYDEALEDLEAHTLARLSRIRPMYLESPRLNALLNFSTEEDNDRFWPIGAGQINYEYAAESIMLANNITIETDAVAPPTGKFSTKQSSSANESPLAAPRTNFSETAFFLAHLQTDSEGRLSWTGTIPERLSKYRLCLFAYDRELYDLVDTQSIETYREIMIEALMPRFVRYGDESYLTGSVRNTTDQQIQGTLRLHFPLQSTIPDVSQSLDLAAKESKSYAILLPPLQADAGSITLQLEYSSPQGGDAIRADLPLLPASSHVVESFPIQYQPDTLYELPLQHFLDSHKNKIPNGQLQLQLWTNPKYFALLQMPTLFANKEMDVINTIYRIYSLVLSKQILQREENKEWIEKQQANLSDLNKLKQNQPLLLSPLNETPWQANSGWIDEAYKTLSGLSLNPEAYTSSKDLQTLESLQTYNGHWSWYPSMPASPELTPFLIRLLSQINHIESSPIADRMLDRAWRAYDRLVMEKIIDEQKNSPDEHRNDQSIAYWGIEWLYLSLQYRSINLLRQQQETAAILDYLQPQLLISALELPLDKLAQVGMILHILGEKNKAYEIAKKLRSHLSYEQAQGAFFANSLVSSYFWYERSMTLHRETIDLFNALQLYPSTVRDMQRWAMEYLRTNLSPATTSQVEMLLSLLCDPQASSTQIDHVLVTIPMRNGSVETHETDTQLLIILNPDQLSPNHTIRIEHARPEETLWGGLLYTGERPWSDVQAINGELTIEQLCFVREFINGEIHLRPISDGEPLDVGTILITQLRVTTHRDLDFVTIRDTRPACCEPLEQLSHYTWMNGIGVYIEPRDTVQLFHIPSLPRGAYLLTYEQCVQRPGIYQRGISQAQCAYAPELSAQTTAHGNWISH